MGHIEELYKMTDISEDERFDSYPNLQDTLNELHKESPLITKEKTLYRKLSSVELTRLDNQQ